MADSFYDSLQNEDGGRKWEYAEGDTLVGPVVDTFDGEGDYGGWTAYVVTAEADLTTENGEAVEDGEQLIFFVGDHSAVKRSMPASGVGVGDRLGVKFVGEQESKNGRMFKKFNVRVEALDALAAGLHGE